MDQTTRRLRELARRVQEIAMLPIQETRRKQWQGLNDLQMVKPMVYTRDYAWNMVKTGDELQTTIEDEFYQGLEFQLLTTIFQWEHLQADRVVEPVVHCPVNVINRTPIYYKVRSSGQTEALLTSNRSNFQNTAVDYEQRIFDEEDIDRVIPMPHIEVDDSTLDREWGRVNEIFDGILTVEKKGVGYFPFTPWDDVFRLFSFEEGMMNLYTEPELMHKAVKRYVDMHIEMLKQHEQTGLLHNNNGNTLVGSGALGYTSQLPKGTGIGVKASDSWGFATDQIFTSVSPAHMNEFATQHEIPYLERFGLTYFGCCECLDNKFDVLRQIKNLRKISSSPYTNLEKAMEAIGGDYVVSFKPNSVLLATEMWDKDASRAELINACKLAEKYGCNIEIVMKTMITLHNQPQRLRDWCKMASEITNAI